MAPTVAVGSLAADTVAVEIAVAGIVAAIAGVAFF